MYPLSCTPDFYNVSTWLEKKGGGGAIPAPLTTSAYSFLLKTFKFGKSVYLA